MGLSFLHYLPTNRTRSYAHRLGGLRGIEMVCCTERALWVTDLKFNIVWKYMTSSSKLFCSSRVALERVAWSNPSLRVY